MRAVLVVVLVLIVWSLGVWHGRTEERLDRPIRCPKVEARRTPSGQLDTLTVIPEDCR